jgi:hypothetical protein
VLAERCAADRLTKAASTLLVDILSKHQHVIQALYLYLRAFSHFGAKPMRSKVAISRLLDWLDLANATKGSVGLDGRVGVLHAATANNKTIKKTLNIGEASKDECNVHFSRCQ